MIYINQPLPVRAKLNSTLIKIKPVTKRSIAHLFFRDIFEALYKRKLTIKLVYPQIRFNIGGDKPFPGGFAKGVGK
jgi:hypothetical protein